MSTGHVLLVSQKHAALGGPPFPISPVPQVSSDIEAPEDSFAEERALISAQAHIPVGGKLQFFLRNWKVIKASKRVVRWCRKGYRLLFAPDGKKAALILLRTVCLPDRILHYRPGTPKHKALTDMIKVFVEKHVLNRCLQDAIVSSTLFSCGV